ncbi:MAG: hypothetical protein SGCHY_005313 [Lobulomycetales sp.]
MGRGSALLILVLAAAWATAPTQDSFRKYIRDSAAAKNASWIERTILAHLMNAMYEVQDYKFFSIVRVDDDDMLFLGVFGTWIPVKLK